MNRELIDSVSARWVRLGAMLNVQPARVTPDVERLLLDTARVSSANTRLFILAATWLANYGDYVAKHRLARLIRDELKPEHRPTLGFMLEWAKLRGESNGSRFNLAIESCGSAGEPRPLADSETRNPVFARLAQQRASALSRKWGRWTEDFEPKANALRPLAWVIEHNPSLADRAMAGGDLMASILAEFDADPKAIESESELARRCGASRPAIRDAIRRLRMAGRIEESSRVGRNRPVTPTSHHAA